MKYLGFFLTIVIAWAVRMACGWVAAKFGTEVDPATQTEVTNWMVGGILVAGVAVVETFERLAWPRIKARLVAWWDKKFPPVKR